MFVKKCQPSATHTHTHTHTQLTERQRDDEAYTGDTDWLTGVTWLLVSILDPAHR